MRQIERIEDFAEIEKYTPVRIYRFGGGVPLYSPFVSYLEAKEAKKIVFVEQIDDVGNHDFFEFNEFQFSQTLFFVGDYNYQVFKEAWEEKVKKWYTFLFGNNNDDSLPF